MYGLLLENLSEYVKTVYGDDKWDEIRKAAGNSMFNDAEIYLH